MKKALKNFSKDFCFKFHQFLVSQITTKRHFKLNAPQHLFCRCLCTNCKKFFCEIFDFVRSHVSLSLFLCARIPSCRARGCHIDGYPYSNSARKPEVIHKSYLFFCFVDGFMTSKEALEAIEALISRRQVLCDCIIHCGQALHCTLTIGRHLVLQRAPSS